MGWDWTSGILRWFLELGRVESHTGGDRPWKEIPTLKTQEGDRRADCWTGHLRLGWIGQGPAVSLRNATKLLSKLWRKVFHIVN